MTKPEEVNKEQVLNEEELEDVTGGTGSGKSYERFQKACMPI